MNENTNANAAASGEQIAKGSAKRNRPQPKRRTFTLAKPEEKGQPAVLTPDEQAIAARVAGDAGREWERVSEVIDFQLGKDLFALPPAAKKQQDNKKFVFRWIERTPRRLDEIRSKEPPFKWWVCNSTNTPFLKGEFDPILGCVTREDQMLMFQPYWMKVKRDEILHRQNEGVKDITQKDGESKGDGMSFVAGRKIEDRDRPIVAQGITNDLGEFIDEQGQGSPEDDE